MNIPLQVASAMRSKRGSWAGGSIQPSGHGEDCGDDEFACGCTGSNIVVCCDEDQTCSCGGRGPRCEDPT